ncbi:hypothetical protein CD351_06250 [Erythrobacter sp. KY5]|nr:hypothetical protein CD351_06250 [Erythrobacter sp. KY5]
MPSDDLIDDPASGTRVPLGDRINPGFETLDPENEELVPVGPDGWYDVGRDGEVGASSNAGLRRSVPTPTPGFTPEGPLDSTQNRIIAAFAALLGLLAVLAGVIWWRRRREEMSGQEIPNTVLASGVLGAIPGRNPKPQQPSGNVGPVDAQVDQPASDGPEGSEPEASAQPELEAVPPEPLTPAPPLTDVEPARIDVDIDIPLASRSMMMFMIEFSLEVANRSDRAVRDLTIAAKLACARKGGSNAAPAAGGQPIATIERIGPQQSRRVTGKMQLPLAEVTAIRQGSKPLFIPLLHVTFEGEGVHSTTRSFVLGTPSAASGNRVHPLPLDGPPGSLPPMRAQPLKQPVTQPAQGDTEEV